MPKSEKTLYDFFTVKPHKIQQEEPSSLNSKASTEGTDSQISVEETEETHPMRLDSPRLKLKHTRGKKGAHKLLLKRKKTVFRLPKLSEDPKALLRQKELLAKALISKNITFDDNLCFSNPDCPPQANNTEFEPNLQVFELSNRCKTHRKLENGHRESRCFQKFQRNDKEWELCSITRYRGQKTRICSSSSRRHSKVHADIGVRRRGGFRKEQTIRHK